MSSPSQQIAEITAISRYTKMSPSKVRRTLKLIKGKTYEEASKILKFSSYRACKPVSQVLDSAASNTHNKTFCEKDLVVKSAFANKGSVNKRFRLRARGKPFQILKFTTHITVILSYDLSTF